MHKEKATFLINLEFLDLKPVWARCYDTLNQLTKLFTLSFYDLNLEFFFLSFFLFFSIPANRLLCVLRSIW